MYSETPYLIHKFLEWAYEQRKLHLPNARKLSDGEKLRLAGYFDKRILDLTRVVSVAHISNPKFYNELIKSGISIPLDFTQAVGLTLIDCVLIRKELCSNPPSWINTLFHEMVHVVQFDILGPARLVSLYADCLLQNKYQYHSVPFERQAYTLTDKFVGGEPPFSVREVIKQELSQIG